MSRGSNSHPIERKTCHLGCHPRFLTMVQNDEVRHRLNAALECDDNQHTTPDSSRSDRTEVDFLEPTGFGISGWISENSGVPPPCGRVGLKQKKRNEEREEPGKSEDCRFQTAVKKGITIGLMSTTGNFPHDEKVNMLYMYGRVNGNGRAALQMYYIQFTDRQMPYQRIFQRLHRQLREKGVRSTSSDMMLVNEELYAFPA
ncbi:hypothetical protein TNCV_1354261 [Trichonephila clavipes]|nr:hypothetical protein TNCV_1354261 [Trichonephila clavipes]